MVFTNSESWTILSKLELSIKNKIDQCGIRLKDWDIKIYRGVLTGYNEAFIINGEKKDELIAADPKSADLIRPILRGRDIKRYGYTFADLWLISTFPSRNYDINDFPAVRDYLLSFGLERLEQSGKKKIVDGKEVKARKKTNNKWFETQDSINYWDDFSKHKIVYAETMRVHRTGTPERFPRFSYIENGSFLDKTCFMITGQHLLYILAIINSSLMQYYIQHNIAVLDTGGFLMQKIYVDAFPIPSFDNDEYEPIVSLCKEVLREQEKGNDTLGLEAQIDSYVYKLFGLNSDEIAYIQSQMLGA